ncbi:MAG: phenylalanine--tRNA ligase subunit alpha [Firmicutes bacterium]|nr:phenylalanine--tRNA ligase subunit alpha [Bacillota bacterium]
MMNLCEELLSRATAQIDAADSAVRLEALRVALLGKQGELTALLKGLKDLPDAERPAVGKAINDARTQIENALSHKKSYFEDAALRERLQSERVDFTIDIPDRPIGSIHPINHTRQRICDFFVSMGFFVADSPEIETEFYNFEALNIPSDHPAREVQDTFFLADGIVLRSQTSSGQIRFMEKYPPPFKMISPGRVYRCDDVDATHSPMFHQLEGLVVDKNITMCDLKGILELFAKHFFGSQTKTRFRPSFFPFTEPSVEVDASCFNCGGKGQAGGVPCRVCKGTGWIEILGAGLVNRRVLQNVGVNPDVYSGFAFGMGLDRITNILHGITDLRVVFENDVRFLKQFR